MLKKIIDWLGVEANARAVTVLLSVGATTGAGFSFLVDKALPVRSEPSSSASFTEAFERGKREAALEGQLRTTEAQLELEREYAKISDEFCSMSDKEKHEYIVKRLREGSL